MGRRSGGSREAEPSLFSGDNPKRLFTCSYEIVVWDVVVFIVRYLNDLRFCYRMICVSENNEPGW